MTAARPTSRFGPAVAALVAAATYSSFLAGPALHSKLSATRSFVSELEAAGQPHRELFRATDVVSGILIVLVAGALHRRLGTGQWRSDRRADAGCLLIAALGLASITDGVTRMGCAPSLDAACRARDSSIGGLLSQVLEAHTLSGLAGFVGGSLGPLLIGLTLRYRAPLWARASSAIGVALAAIGLLDVALLAADGPFGLAERGRAVTVSCWLVLAAWFVFRGTGRAGAGLMHSTGYAGTASTATAAGSSAGSATGHR